MADVIRRALATHRGHWGSIAAAAGVALVPAALLQGLIVREAVTRSDEPLLFGALVVGGAAAGMLGYFFLGGVIAHIAVARRRGEPVPGFGQIARELPWRNLVVVDLVVSVGTAVGLELLVVPGLVIGTWFAFASVLVETRQLGPREALAGSRELTRGCFWQVLSLILVPLVLTTGVSYSLQDGLEALLSWHPTLEWGLAALLAGAIVKPFASVVTVELALELDDVRSPP